MNFIDLFTLYLPIYIFELFLLTFNVDSTSYVSVTVLFVGSLVVVVITVVN
jgi:hypothetical protein